MKILCYRGKSIVSRLIRFQTRSKYSHVAVMLDDGSMVEAWHKGGVLHRDDPFDGHSPGTLIDVYGIQSHYDPQRVQDYLQAQLGKKYDWWSVARFVSRRHAKKNNRLFCSELALEAFAYGGLRLLHGISAEMSPRDVSISPRLCYESTMGSTD